MSWKLRAAVSALLLAPQAAFSLGLGDIHLKSALNEPFSAQIELVAPTSDELNSLTATLASPELFQRYGLDRPAYLDALQFRVGRGSDGRNVLLVSSTKPINEPFVTLLVEVNWPRGHLLREYTVLLDPPVFAPKEAAAPAPVAAPRVARPAPAAVPAAAPVQPGTAAAAPAVPAGEGPSSYRVQRGDTLYGVAARYTDGSHEATDRMMIAMFRDNPEAFSGNINLLRAGSILRVPGPDAVASVAPADAAREIGRQNSAWRREEAPAQEAERLRLVAPKEPVSETAATAAPATKAEVESRISELNKEIDESRRLLDLKSAELAKLQQQLAAPPAQAPAAPAAGSGTAAAPGAAPAPAETPPATEATPAPAPAAEAPKPAPKVAAKPPQKPAPAERSFVDSLTDNWQYVLGAAVLLLGGGLAYGYTRRRREEDLDDAIRTFEAPAAAPVPTETQRLRTLSGAAARPAALVGTTTEEQELEDFRTATLPPSGRKAEDHGVRFEDTLSAETPTDLDQGDPLAEADFHMAYGLYDQAADIVRLALDKEPSRRDLKMKLLEIFFVAGDKARFLDAARDFATARGDGDRGDWDRVVIMGRQLAPEDPLFASAASGAGVDLNLEGGESRVDLELLTPPGGDEGIDLDLGEALVAADSEADTGEMQALDFDLDTAAAEAPTAEMPRLRETTAEMPRLGDSTAEMPTVEVRASDQAPTVEATRLHPVTADTTAEMPMDDLGIDLGDLDALSQIAPEDDVTRITPAGESTRLMPAGDKGMDFDLADLSPEVAGAATGDSDDTQRIDLDVGGAMAESTGEFTATEQISVDELPHAADLEPVTLSEVGTKLDLARAYVDMGDPDGARSILDEVLKEGSTSQKQEAQRLLDSLPGA